MFKAPTTNTSVFPVPDLAWITKSIPRLTRGKDCHWTGEGDTYLAAFKPRVKVDLIDILLGDGSIMPF